VNKIHFANGDKLGSRHRVNSERHLEGVIERVWRCNWRLRLRELSDVLGGCDLAIIDMHLEAVIERVWRCTRKL